MSTPQPPDDAWPEPDAPTLAQTRETLVSPPPPEPVGPPPDRRIGSGMLLALGAIALVALGFLITWLLTHRHHAKQRPTTVVVTQPPTTNAQGQKLVVVPDVRGVQAPHAADVLRSLGLKPRTTQVAAAGKPAGAVVTESPKVGAKVTKGSQVLLSVARGTHTTAATTTAKTTTAQTTTAQTTTAAAPPQPTTATVPDLGGDDEAGAVQALGGAGLLASLAFVPSSDPLGTVEAQSKSAGTTVPYRSHVQVNISTGPGQKPMEQVPDVKGKRLQDAVNAMNAAHLRLIYLKLPVTSRSLAGTIVQQSPNGGDHAPQNAQVLVYLAVYRK